MTDASHLLGASPVPLALLAWLAVAPPRSALGIAAQTAATAAALLVLARVGLWMFPPWWTPHALGVALVIAAGVAVLRRRPVERWPQGLRGWVGVLLSAGLAAYALALAPRTIDAASPPPGPIVELVFPLAGGTFLVANGGNDVLVNAHRESMLSSDPRFARWRGNGYSVDIVAVDAWGLRAAGVMPAAPAAYRIHGLPLYAPCDGSVVLAVDGLPDMRVPEFDRANLAGNHVIVACGDDVHVVTAHLRNGSVAVRAGDRVAPGQRIGEVGNSGGSNEPHLHIHAQRPGPAGAPMAGDPLPARLGGRFLVRGDRVVAAPRHRRDPPATATIVSIDGAPPCPTAMAWTPTRRRRSPAGSTTSASSRRTCRCSRCLYPTRAARFVNAV